MADQKTDNAQNEDNTINKEENNPHQTEKTTAKTPVGKTGQKETPSPINTETPVGKNGNNTNPEKGGARPEEEPNLNKTTPETSPKEKEAQIRDSGQKPSDGEKTSEKENSPDDHGIPMKPYGEMNLEALTEELERLLKAHDVKDIRNHVRKVKMEFDAKFDKEREQKKEAFLNDGGSIIDFSYSTTVERKFNELYFDYKERRDNYYKKLHKNLNENLERRLAIIEELKAMIGVGNDMQANFRKFKKLQERWRQAGPVPKKDYKNTWNTYHHHVERFYDFLHLDREFREMDHKHNLNQKLKLIARAEELANEPDVNRAFRELQSLHRMWKEDVGPVAKEYHEPIWEKFRAATKTIHENRKAYYAELDKKREKNLRAKQDIIKEIETLEQQEIRSHHDAQEKIKRFKDLRDKFFKAGKVPHKNNQETWNAFKEASRNFNHEKNEFYRNRKEAQQENLSKKRELIKIAEDNKDSEDFENVTPLMKKIQSDWKKIGFVPHKKSEKIWREFKAACNHYFDRLHARQDEKTKKSKEAFSQKKTVLEETKAMELTGNRKEDLGKIKEKIEAWKQLENVPKQKKYIEGKFNKTLDKLFKRLDLNKKEAEMLKYEKRLDNLEQSGNDERIKKEANFLRKKISQTEDEVRQLETNLEFFDNADKDNPLMKEAFKNIEQHRQQLKIWKAKYNKLKDL